VRSGSSVPVQQSGTSATSTGSSARAATSLELRSTTAVLVVLAQLAAKVQIQYRIRDSVEVLLALVVPVVQYSVVLVQ
jgi:hypothetical protein